MRDTSMIEYARIGVRVGREGCTDCGGGIVTIKDSKFKDNPTGLYFDPYQRYLNGGEAYNYGRVANTNFTWTADLRGLGKPLRHVDVRESGGLTFRGNTYQNEDYGYYDFAERGTGIYSANSQVTETWLCTAGLSPCPAGDLYRSQFLHLSTGIDAYGNSTRTLQAHYGVYMDNNIGIGVKGLYRPEILNNDFRVPNRGNTVGIYLVGSTGYAVENNFFQGMSKVNIDWNFGIAVHASGAFENELYRNRFKNLGTGIASTDTNAVAPEYDFGLRWKCNTFDQTIAFADIRVESGSVSDEQGTCHTGVTGRRSSTAITRSRAARPQGSNP